MNIKPDIVTRQDIEKLILCFYEKVKADETIGFIFTSVVEIDWSHHIPVIVDFWETILLDNPVYQKNAMEVHYTLNKKMPLQASHFAVWLQLFSSAVDELYMGQKAELAKKRAASIASLMQFKMKIAT